MSHDTPPPPKPPRPSAKGLWLRRLGRVLEVGDEAADILVHVREVSLPGAASLGLRLVNSVRNRFTQSPQQYFQSDAWEEFLELGPFSDFLYSCCSELGNPTRVEGLDDEFQQAVLTDVHGFTFGWLLGDRESRRSAGPWVVAGTDHDQAVAAMGRLVWERMGTSRCVMTTQSERLTFSAEPQVELLESQLSLEVLGRAKLFIAKGLNRSVLLLGDPGTGKSCMMRFLADSMGGYSLRIAVADLEDANMSHFTAAIRLLAPASLLIDDFDRMDGHAKLLAALEDINRSVKLFVVSCNSIEHIDDAILRPGRFDEIHIIEQLDHGVVEQLIGDVPKQARDILIQLPIAAVAEFGKRREALGLETAIDELFELVERSHKLELLRKRKRRGRLRRPRTPAQRARLAAARLKRLETNLARTLSSVPKQEERVARAQVRAETMAEKAEQARVEGRKKASKKAAKTRARKKKARVAGKESPPKGPAKPAAAAPSPPEPPEPGESSPPPDPDNVTPLRPANAFAAKQVSRGRRQRKRAERP